MALDDDLAVIGRFIANDATRTEAHDAYKRVLDAVELMRQRYADRELARMGDIMRRAVTADAFIAAQRESQQQAPELWRGVLPMRERTATTVQDDVFGGGRNENI